MIFFRRHRQARDRADQAGREAEHAQRRLEETRQQVIRPLRAYKERNQFADMIRASLTDGRR